MSLEYLAENITGEKGPKANLRDRKEVTSRSDYIMFKLGFPLAGKKGAI
jgi:hypothetical protein